MNDESARNDVRLKPLRVLEHRREKLHVLGDLREDGGEKGAMRLSELVEDDLHALAATVEVIDHVVHEPAEPLLG